MSTFIIYELLGIKLLNYNKCASKKKTIKRNFFFCNQKINDKCRQGRVDQKKKSIENPIKKWNGFLYGHKKVDSKYFEI